MRNNRTHGLIAASTKQGQSRGPLSRRSRLPLPDRRGSAGLTAATGVWHRFASTNLDGATVCSLPRHRCHSTDVLHVWPPIRSPSPLMSRFPTLSTTSCRPSLLRGPGSVRRRSGDLPELVLRTRPSSAPGRPAGHRPLPQLAGRADRPRRAIGRERPTPVRRGHRRSGLSAVRAFYAYLVDRAASARLAGGRRQRPEGPPRTSRSGDHARPHPCATRRRCTGSSDRGDRVSLVAQRAAGLGGLPS